MPSSLRGQLIYPKPPSSISSSVVKASPPRPPLTSPYRILVSDWTKGQRTIRGMRALDRAISEEISNLVCDVRPSGGACCA